mgnify:CR=1 FL=1
MIAGGSFIFLQNYSYWRKYNNKDSLYLCVAGASVVFLGCWVLVTRFLLPDTLDNSLLELLALSRRVLFALVLVGFAFLGAREYIWKKK